MNRPASIYPPAAGTAQLPSWLRWLALLALCAAYLQGGLVKAMDFAAAVGEMQHFGLAPAAPLAAAVIMLELGASLMILSGFYAGLARFRWPHSRWRPPSWPTASGRRRRLSSSCWPTRSSSISGWPAASCWWRGKTSTGARPRAP